MNKFFILLAVGLLNGCVALGHKQYYEQVAPIKYPETKMVMVFEYSNVDLNKIYELFYSDLLIIGKSGFNGPYQDPKWSIEFAKSIGADVFITSSQFKEIRTTFVTSSTPATSTTYISGYTGTGSVYGTATTYGIRTTTTPVTVNRYDQDGLYLKNINNLLPLWERTRADYKETDVSELSGAWYNENYELRLLKSGKQMVAFISAPPVGKEMWKVDELKMVFSPESGVGFYLMEEKTPQPAEIKLNRFGHLEVKLIVESSSFSFARR